MPKATQRFQLASCRRLILSRTWNLSANVWSVEFFLYLSQIRRMRACIFCGSMEAKLTLEHLFGDWISWAIYPKRKPRQFRQWHKGRDSDEADRIWWSASMDFGGKLLCDICNNQWFSTLENDHVKPIVEPMILKRNRTVLTVENQIALSAWIVRAMILYNHIHEPPKFHFYSPNVRREFRDTLTPPKGVQIWLARYQGRTPQEQGPIVGKLIGFDPRTQKNLRYVREYVFTFSIRQFAAQLHAVKRLHPKAPSFAELGQIFREDLRWSPATVPIWPDPIDGRVWPPRTSLLRGAYEDLVNRWGGTKVSLSPPP